MVPISECNDYQPSSIFLSFGGLALGMILRAVLPNKSFDAGASEVIKLGLGLTTTMNALILGLLISTAKNTYDDRRSQLTKIAADAILLDRTLALYGPETTNARTALKELLAGLAAQIEPVGEGHGFTGSEVEVNDFYYLVRRLKPRDEEQKALKEEVQRASFQIAQIRAIALAQESTSIPSPFMLVLGFWLTILFAGYGLFTPVNLTVISALVTCALFVSAAVLMIRAMDEPLSGIMHISAEPLRNAINIIGKQVGAAAPPRMQPSGR